MEVARIKNLTPHPVNLLREDGSEIAVFPSEGLARLEEQTGNVWRIQATQDDWVAVTSLHYNEIVGIPTNLHPDTWFIVSMPVALAATYAQRARMIYPYPLVRDDQGRVIGCSGFARIGE